MSLKINKLYYYHLIKYNNHISKSKNYLKYNINCAGMSVLQILCINQDLYNIFFFFWVNKKTKILVSLT